MVIVIASEKLLRLKAHKSTPKSNNLPSFERSNSKIAQAHNTIVGPIRTVLASAGASPMNINNNDAPIKNNPHKLSFLLSSLVHSRLL